MMNNLLYARLSQHFCGVLVLLLFLMLASCMESKVVLLSGIAETECNDALAALLDAGISADKTAGKDGLVNLEVASDQVAKAMSTLHAQGLPRERFATMGEVFRKEGLISSPLEERARYLWALSQELSATLSQIDGVILARVQVVLPERSSGGDPALPSSAAVFIKYRAGYQLDDAIPQIKRLVADSIPGLGEDKVSIVLLPFIPQPQMEGTQADAVPVVTSAAPKSQFASIAFKVGTGLISLCILLAAAYFGWRQWSTKYRKVAVKLEPSDNSTNRQSEVQA